MHVLGCAGPVLLVLVALKFWYATQRSLRLGCCPNRSTAVDRDHHGGDRTLPHVCGQDTLNKARQSSSVCVLVRSITQHTNGRTTSPR